MADRLIVTSYVRLVMPNCERQTKIIALQLQWDLVRVAEGRDEMSYSGERDRYIAWKRTLKLARRAFPGFACMKTRLAHEPVLSGEVGVSRTRRTECVAWSFDGDG